MRPASGSSTVQAFPVFALPPVSSGENAHGGFIAGMNLENFCGLLLRQAGILVEQAGGMLECRADIGAGCFLGCVQGTRHPCQGILLY